MQDNIPAVLSVMQFIYDNIMYAELNTKSDYCQECGYDGEIQIKDEESQESLYGSARTVGNRDQDKNVSSQTYMWIYRNTVLESGKNTGD